MDSIKTIIIDDEPKLRKVLKIKLEQYCSDVEVVGVASNISEGYEQIKSSNPQIVFLDISMPGGSGFDLLGKFDEIPFEVIFVTGFNDYVLDALKVSAVDYLLKPVVTEDLVNAVERARGRIADRDKIERYHILKHNFHHLGEQDTKIAIPGANAYDFVQIKDIIRCEGWQKYTRIHLANGTCILSSYNIGVFKGMLENYGFYSTHKSHLINCKIITLYLREGMVIMKDGSQVPVARRKKEEFTEQIIKNILLA